MSLTELTAVSAPLLTLLVVWLAADFALLPALLPVDFARELALLLRFAALEPLPLLLRLAALEPLPLRLRLLLAVLELPLRPRVAARAFPDLEVPFEDEVPRLDAGREDPLRVVAAISLSLRLDRAHRS